jgi:hypothetical protein
MNFKLFSTIFAASLICVLPALADDECPMPKQNYSKELQRMKSLEGSWAGAKVDHGKSETAKVEYKVTSGGSAVVETLFPGTPSEMVSVYHDENGKLALTHYCMLGNQPHLELKKSEFKELDFDFAKDNTINPESEGHMHSLKLSFSGPDKITQRWIGMQNGKSMEPTVIKLERVKEKARG